jgi:hypothetical protein
VAIAPPLSRARNSAASSTVTSPVSAEEDEAASPEEADGSGRERTNVSVSAERPRAGYLPAQPPDQRERRIHDPVLEVDRPYVPDRADPSVRDHLPHEGHGGHPPIVEAAHCPYAMGLRGGRGLDHLSRLGHRVGQGFLAQDVLAGRQRRHRDLGVRVTGGADVDQIDVVALDERTPIGGGRLPAELGRGGRNLRGGATAHHPHSCRQRQVEEVVHGAPRL